MYVPKEDQTGEWDQISSKLDIEERIIKQNRKHLQKAGETPFAHGECYQQLRSAGREKIMKEILDGETDWAHPMEEADAWLNHLK